MRQAQGAVVSLEGFGVDGQTIGSGTGSFIQSGIVGTNFHVVRGVRSMEATLAGGNEVEVVGAAIGGMVLGQNLDFATPSSELIDLLDGSGLASLERPFSRLLGESSWPLVRNLLISAVFFAAVVVGIGLMKD